MSLTVLDFTTYSRTYVYHLVVSWLKQKNKERLHMNHLQDLIRRLRAVGSERRMAQDMNLSRSTVHKYHELTKEQGYLEKGVETPEDETLKKVLEPGPQWGFS